MNLAQWSEMADILPTHPTTDRLQRFVDAARRQRVEVRWPIRMWADGKEWWLWS